MNQETKNCQNCKKDFIIEPEDFNYYEKIKVPPPTFCPECRMHRRWSWRNNMSLYNRNCELCQKPVVSIYAPDSGLIVYCNKCWWSDKWDPKSYAVDYDFSKPFFTQFRELIQRVPQMAIVNDDGIASLNCEYTHDWWFSKNCYMCFGGWYVENVLYSHGIIAGKEIVDCLDILTESERLYESKNCGKSYNMKYSRFCLSCIDSQFLYDCRNCSDCFMCTGLRGKRYFFKNKQYSKEEYEKIIESYKTDTFSGVEKAREEFNALLLEYPRLYATLYQNLNCTGDTIRNSKNSKFCFIAKDCENCRYCDFIAGDKDSYDLTTSGELSECYEGVVSDHSQLNLFGIFSVKSQDIQYTQHCHNCKYTFGSVALRNDKYCILNKQYTKEEYEELVPKIMKQMDEMPYVDKMGSIYKYGEFYPIELSPFGYNETHGPELVPLSKEEAESRGYGWQDNIQKTTGKETLLPENIPDSINDVGDSILEEILKCSECDRNYKITQNELIFYKKMQIPIPRKCFYCRHEARLKQRNPFKLWYRSCMCKIDKHGHTEVCSNEFETPYAPERPETIYCEKCYQAEVY